MRIDAKRLVTLLALAVVLVFVGWSAGRAQTRGADFNLTVDAPAGEIKVRCARGCDWPETPGEPAQSVVYKCDRRPCLLTLNGQGRVYVGQPK
jgi:hypothetical protein